MARLGRDDNGDRIQVLSLGTTHKQAIGATSATVTLTPGTQVVRVVATADCNIAFGATATASNAYFPAGSVEYLRCAGGQLSVIGTSGDLYVTEAI